MDTNIAAWTIAGGPRIELESTKRNREQLYAFRESQRVEREARPGFFARLRGVAATREPELDLVCCTA